MRTVLRAVREVEAICGQPVDIEFALDDAEVFHLLQVRPLTTRHLWSPGTAELVPQRLGNAHDTVARLLGTGATDQPAAGVRGSRSLLGAMPDWNPVELIGPTPRPLASSLFRALITDVTWREARAAIGYHNPENTVLMHLIEGHPFIDVRASFSSLLPATIPATSAHQLIDTWLDRLETLPHLHDKVEFEIVRSCADFTLRTRIEPEFRAALGTAMASEAVTCLIAHTRSLLGLDRVGASLDEALVTLSRRRARQLEQGQNVAPAATRPVMAEPSLAARIATIRLDSAMPFAIAARHAFVAESLLRSAVERGAISGERVAVFRASLEGITSRFAALLREARGNGDVTRLLAEFGHLRPGTFDVRTPCYAQRIDQLLGQAPGPAAAPVGDASSPSFSLRAEEQAALSGLIEETGLAGLSPAGLFDYAARAINGREFGKFVLSRDVSDLLEELVSWGSRRGLDREALSYLSLDRILAGDTERDDGKLGEQGDLTARIAEARREHEIGRHIHLPILICTATDVFVAPMHRSQPNLFGTGVVRAPVVELDAVDDWSRPMAGHIVCIESADPGYDWVFATGASGLITKYGGANSHMAIRCMETGLPAAIGCGEQLFSRIVSSGFVELDFSSQTVQPFDGR
ncbi:MAG: PEP-utilizing enzyme [Pseudomonadales bacterium]